MLLCPQFNWATNMTNWRRSLVFIACLSWVTFRAAAQDTTTKPSVPDAAAVRAATATVDRLYREQAAKVRDRVGETALAKKIQQSATDERDAARKFALLTKAMDLASRAGDIDTLGNCISRMNEQWEIDPAKLWVKAVPDLSRHLQTAQERTVLARKLELVGDQAASESRYDSAHECIDAALPQAQRGNDPALTRELLLRQSNFAHLKTAAARVKPALATLSSKPEDPAANAVVGRFQCSVEGNWSAGLAKLARGNDPALKDLAQKDLAAPAAATDQAALADDWWERARREDDWSRVQVQLHAAELYRKAIPRLPDASQLRAEQRISEAASQAVALGISPRLTVPLRILNLTNAREAAFVLADVLRESPDILNGAKEVVLMRYYNGTDFQHSSGKTTRLSGAFSPSPAVAAAKGFLFYGVHEEWKPGRYVIVYRMQALSPAGNGYFCTNDIYTGAEGLAAHQVNAREVPPGRWSSIAMDMNLEEPKSDELRMFTNKEHTVALDRVYIFQVR